MIEDHGSEVAVEGRVLLGVGDACVAVQDAEMIECRAKSVDEIGAIVAPDDGREPFRVRWGDVYLVPNGPRGG